MKKYCFLASFFNINSEFVYAPFDEFLSAISKKFLEAAQIFRFTHSKIFAFYGPGSTIILIQHDKH